MGSVLLNLRRIAALYNLPVVRLTKNTKASTFDSYISILKIKSIVINTRKTVTIDDLASVRQAMFWCTTVLGDLSY